MIDYYQNQKFKKNRRKKTKFFIALFLFFLLVIIGGIVYFFNSPYSKIKTINVNIENQDKVLSDNFINSYNSEVNGKKYFFEKIFGENSIFTPLFYSSDIVSSIEKNISEVKDVKIKTNIFSRSVDIEGTIRQKFGLWCLNNQHSTSTMGVNSATSSLQSNLGQITASTSTSSDSNNITAPNFYDSTKCFWFDNDGVAFMEGPDTEGQLIYKVMDSYDSNINIGQTILSGELIKNIISDFDFLDKSGLGYKILYLSDPSLEEVHTDVSVKPVIYFSLRNDPAYALDAFLKYKSDFIKSGYVDLRIPNRIYYK